MHLQVGPDRVRPGVEVLFGPRTCASQVQPEATGLLWVTDPGYSGETGKCSAAVPDSCQNELARGVLGWHGLALSVLLSSGAPTDEQLRKVLQTPLSRRRHGFESRWGCSGVSDRTNPLMTTKLARHEASR